MDQNTSPKWTIRQTFAYRAFAIYLALFFVFTSDFIGNNYYDLPIIRDFNAPFLYLRTGLITFVNMVFLHQKGPVQVDIGDNYWDWVCAITFIMLAVLAALAWTILDKGKKFNSLYKYTNAFARYYLAYILLNYGMVKIDFNQFKVSPYAMLSRIGYSGSFQVFRAFMGISKSYMFFGGLIEILPAILLLFRRTAVFGAMVATLVLINVLMLNIGYDLSIKLMVFSLVLFSVFIWIPEVKQLAQIFVLKQSTAISHLPPVIENKKYSWLRYILKLSAIGLALFAQLELQIRYINENNIAYKTLAGIHEIKEFSQHSPNNEKGMDSLEWTCAAINQFPEFDVWLKNDSVLWFYMKVDTTKKTLDIKAGADTTYRGTLHYTNIKPGFWLFQGKLKNDSIRFVTKRTDIYDMPTLKGYGKVKWIN